jgi:hypothetical protein
VKEGGFEKGNLANLGKEEKLEEKQLELCLELVNRQEELSHPE